jgi:hypothetical protein
VKLSRITNKRDTYFRAQGYEPQTLNPDASGVNSPVADYMAYCELYEAAEPGAGQTLSSRVHAELMDRFLPGDALKPQKELNGEILKEAFDVLNALNENDLDTASKSELKSIATEISELREKADEAFAHVTALIRMKDCRQFASEAVGRRNGR